MILRPIGGIITTMITSRAWEGRDAGTRIDDYGLTLGRRANVHVHVMCAISLV